MKLCFAWLTSATNRLGDWRVKSIIFLFQCHKHGSLLACYFSKLNLNLNVYILAILLWHRGHRAPRTIDKTYRNLKGNMNLNVFNSKSVDSTHSYNQTIRQRILFKKKKAWFKFSSSYDICHSSMTFYATVFVFFFFAWI